MSGVVWHSEWSEEGPVGYWDFEDVAATAKFRLGAPEEYREVCEAVVMSLGDGLRNGGWRVAGNDAMSDGWDPSRLSALVTLEFRLQNPSGGPAFNGAVDTFGTVSLITYYTDVSLEGAVSDEMELRVAVVCNTDVSRVFELNPADTQRLLRELGKLRLRTTK